MERHVSPLNGNLNNPKDLIICDVTLREGEQTPGVTFNFDEKIALVEKLDKIGVSQIQISHPKFSEKLLEFCTKICSLDLKCKTEIMSHGTWDKCIEAIDLILKCNPDIIHSYFPITPYSLDGWNSDSPHFLEQRIKKVTEYIKKNGKIANISLLDSTRADLKELLHYVEIAVKSGADRVRLPDTVGVATPEAIYEMISRAVEIAEPYGAVIGVHTHNDYGLALANTLSGIKAGAKLVDVSVNGLGDRAGNTSLAELAASLEVLYGCNSGIDIKKIIELSKYVEQISGVMLPYNKPIVGQLVFSDQSELHFLSQVKRKYAFQGVLPEVFGTKRSLLYGKLTSDKIIKITEEMHGRKINPKYYPKIKEELYNVSENNKGKALFEEDFWSIVDSIEKNN